MKTKQEVLEMAQDLDKKRIQALIERDNAKTEMDRSVSQNLVLIYAMQHNILLEVLE